MKTRLTQLAIATLIGAGGLYLFVSYIEDWGLLWQAITQASIGYIILGMLLQYAGMIIRALRWQSFLGQPHVSSVTLFNFANIGFMANGVLPARMGELVRAFLIWRHTPHAFTTGLATIVVERVFDLLGILLILAYVLAFFQFPALEQVDPSQAVQVTGQEEAAWFFSMAPKEWVAILAAMGGAIFMGLFLAVAFMTYAPNLSSKLAYFCFRPLPRSLSGKLLGMIETFEKGATTFRRPASFAYCFVLSILLWLVIAFSELVILWAFGIDKVGFNGALFLMVGLCFAVMFPQLPGYIGVYQAAVIAILGNTFGIDASLAGAVAIVMWISQVPPIILMGFLCLLATGISFSEITHVQEEVPRDTDSNQKPSAQTPAQ